MAVRSHGAPTLTFLSADGLCCDATVTRPVPLITVFLLCGDYWLVWSWCVPTALHLAVLPANFGVSGVTPGHPLIVGVTTVVVIEAFAGVVVRGLVVFLWCLSRPALAGFARLRHSDRASVRSALTSGTGHLWDDGGRLGRAARNGAEVPSFGWAGGEAPGFRVSIRVSTVVIFKVLFWEYAGDVAMVVRFLGVPALAGEAIFSGGDFPSVVFTTAVYTVIGAAGYITVLPSGVDVGGVTPGSTAVSIRISAEVGVQVCSRVGLWGEIWSMWECSVPSLTHLS